jgi:hypothetical protein
LPPEEPAPPGGFGDPATAPGGDVARWYSNGSRNADGAP